MVTFENNEDGYRQWVKDNPLGFVINTPKSGGYLMLHRANCTFISSDKRTHYTTGDYKKICSTDRQELVDWAKKSGNIQYCSFCKP